MRHRKRVILLVALLVVGVLAGLFLIPEEIEGPGQSSALTITYVLPDDYNGLVVIRFGDADPAPFAARGELTINVPVNGEVTLEHAVPGQDELHHVARYASGQRLPRRSDRPDPDEIAFYHLSTQIPPNSTNLSGFVETWLVGTWKQFADWSERDPEEFRAGPFN